MYWKKLGHLFNPEKTTGAQGPTLFHTNDNKTFIYFGSRDEKGRSLPYRIEINLNDPYNSIQISDQPIFNLGKIGTFDENGIIPTSLVYKDNDIYIYYIAFSRTAPIIYSANSGLAISKDNGKTAQKAFQGPIKAQSIKDPFFATVQWVLNDNDLYKMWYISGDKWEEDNKELKHYYHINYCESTDGINWTNEQNAITFQNKHEYAFGKPCVIKDGPEDYKMWYSFRAQPGIDTYRIGYAESKDGKTWTRKDELMKHFDVGNEGEWDSDMICYPYVFDHNGKRYMLYNGNGYGRTGFGLAVMEDE